MFFAPDMNNALPEKDEIATVKLLLNFGYFLNPQLSLSKQAVLCNKLMSLPDVLVFTGVSLPSMCPKDGLTTI